VLFFITILIRSNSIAKSFRVPSFWRMCWIATPRRARCAWKGWQTSGAVQLETRVRGS
jgi:hypothetical protein